MAEIEAEINAARNDFLPPLISYNNKSYILKTATTQITENTYTNLSMGVSVKVDNQQFRGVLHKFNNIMSVEFSKESYTNIGSFTLEHLNDVIKKIKNEGTILNQKKTVPYSYSITSGSYLQESFFTAYLSTGLIFGNSMCSLRIIEDNTFENIWTIDRKHAMEKSLTGDREEDYGLILYLKNFMGSLQVGDPQVINSGNTATA